MADEGLSTAFGNAIVAVFEWTWPRVAPRIHAVAERLAELVLPDPPMTVRTLDGEILTGVLIVDRGQVLAFLGSRHAARVHAPQPTTPRYEQRYPFESEEDLWSRGVNPYPR